MPTRVQWFMGFVLTPQENVETRKSEIADGNLPGVQLIFAILSIAAVPVGMFSRRLTGHCVA